MRFSVAILAVVLAYTWVIDPMAPGWVTPIPVILVLALAVWHHLSTEAHAGGNGSNWGFTPSAFVPALWRAALITALAAIAIAIAGARLGTWHDDPGTATSLALLIPWGFGQQFALQTVFLRESQTTVGRPVGIVLAAVLFAALHLPNPFLTAMTFAGALAWCSIFDRYPNVLPLSLSHALLTLAILRAFDERTTGHLRVGAAYLNLR
jgi:membrane protease YdiL (CAAX protease family)